MPAPADKAGVKGMLGLAQYLSKFMQQLTNFPKPLRELTQNDIESAWDNEYHIYAPSHMKLFFMLLVRGCGRQTAEEMLRNS